MSAVEDVTEEAPAVNLRRKGAAGFLWQGLAYISGKAVIALTTILLARLLTPDQFGLVALATVFITFADVIADGGVAQALVYLERDRRTIRAALLVALATGGMLAAGALVAAPVIARFFDEPDVTALVRVLSLALLVGVAGSVPEALLRRSFAYRRLATCSVIRALVIGTTSITLAVLGFGAWSLVWGSVSGAVAYAVCTWVSAARQTDVRIWLVRRAETTAVLRYGVPAALGILLSRLIFDLDYLIVGRQLGAEALGLYTVAFRLPELAIINVFFVISSVTFPLYSRARANPSRLRAGYLTSVRIQSFYGVCAGVGLATIAPVAVPALLGDEWLPAVGCLAALGLYAALRSLGAGANDLYKAVGRPSLSVWVSLLRLAVLVPSLIVATEYGILGVAWTQAGLAACFAVLMQSVACRVIKLPATDLLRALLPALCGGAVVALAVWPVVHLLPGSSGMRLVVGLVAGTLAAAASLTVTGRPILRDLRAVVRNRR